MNRAVALTALLAISQGAGAAQALPQCWPSNVGGVGSYAVIGSIPTHRFIVWKCPATPTLSARAVVIVAINKVSIKIPKTDGLSLADQMVAWWNANVLLNYTDPTLAPALTAMIAALKTIPDPAPIGGTT